MFVYGARSRQCLATCHPWLIDVAQRALDYQAMDIAIICGHRPRAAQDEAFATGVSKVEWPDSRHNLVPSMAFDAAPYPIDWHDTLAFARMAGLMAAAAAELAKAPSNDNGWVLRWGGDWNRDGRSRDQSFMDLGHFELVLS